MQHVIDILFSYKMSYDTLKSTENACAMRKNCNLFHFIIIFNITSEIMYEIIVNDINIYYLPIIGFTRYNTGRRNDRPVLSSTGGTWDYYSRICASTDPRCLMLHST